MKIHLFVVWALLACGMTRGQTPAAAGSAARAQLPAVKGDREVWLEYMDKVARPVFSALAEDRLRMDMPVTLSVSIDNKEERSRVTYLEAWGRVLSGIAPWLNGEGGSAAEVALRQQYRGWAVKAVANSVNPAAKDYMVWKGGQPLVDASFFALGLIRCPWLWRHLDPAVQQQVIAALKMTRATVPGYSNWILFPAMIEAFFCNYGLEYDPVRIEYAVREFSQHWYVGDGTFSDGPSFHQDYYNSYVIQPYLSAIVAIVNGRYGEMGPRPGESGAGEKEGRYGVFADKLDKITKRYAEIQERMINTDGSYPVAGRSITYRCGAFHQLADMAARRQLPASLLPGQVRSALTAVIQKTLGAAGTFTPQGWLTIGVHGRQEQLADSYITGGSLYLCSEVFLPLGLPPADPFWSSPSAPWTSVKIWGGADGGKADHALDLN
jgi:hypothetical protein